MKIYYKILLLVIIVLIVSSNQLYSEKWIQYTNGNNITAIAQEGDILWVGTDVGLVKINKINGDTEF